MHTGIGVDGPCLHTYLKRERHMLRVAHQGTEIAIGHDDLLRHTTGKNVVAAALCYRMMNWMFSALSPESPPERSRLLFRIAFDGPGIIDCLELVTGAKSDRRIRFDPHCAPPDAPPAPAGQFYFDASYGDRSCSAYPDRSVFPPSFVDQVRRFQDGGGTAAEQSAYQHMKEGFAAQILKTPVDSLFRTRVWSDGAAADRIQ